MDDDLETPDSALQKALLTNPEAEDDEREASDEEEGGLDWTKLSYGYCLKLSLLKLTNTPQDQHRQDQ